jgi:hypothetical protein
MPARGDSIGGDATAASHVSCIDEEVEDRPVVPPLMARPGP